MFKNESASTKAKIAVVGGGTAGSTIALYLSELGLDITLFEQEASLVNGPPFCHLHAGGNLYREISDEQCVTLLKESIDLLRFYPFAVDYRPTVIAVPKEDKGKPEDLFKRLGILQKEYALLIEKDPGNKVLGESENYYKTYSYEAIKSLQQRADVSSPTTLDEWMIPVAKNIDLEKVQFPLILVQEYGLNLFRLGSGVTLALNSLPNCQLFLKTKVSNIQTDKEKNGWYIDYENSDGQAQQHFDFLINAAGFRTGQVDDMLNFHRKRLVEFKAAYVSKWEDNREVWPEIVFYGERGTPQGMAQFTPYPGGYFQLHGMTNAITLFDNGLVRSSEKSAQPRLNKAFLKRIEQKWEFSEIDERTQAAIKHIAQYIPAFKSAKVASKPLFGAQQIPGDDASLRAANVSFENQHYARCEIVKVSSVLSMSDAITKQLIKLDYIDSSLYKTRTREHLNTLSEKRLKTEAIKLCHMRVYPLAIAERSVPCLGCQVTTSI